jgi:oligopeptide transport system substrate-binding protein
VDTLRTSIPWLPMENTARPTTIFYMFNLSKPPFTNVLVRQAFAAAIDREIIAQVARDGGATDPRPATSITPPETLGRDLFNVVGVSFKPSDARELLNQAGYTDLSTFPTITLMTNRGIDELNIRLSEAMIRMWEIHLGIKVQLEVVKSAYFDRVNSDPTEIYWNGWSADYNDPDDFLLEVFHTGSLYNANHFSNVEFDNLVDQAAEATDPLIRQDLYIQAERILCEQEVALIPVYFTTANIP